MDTKFRCFIEPEVVMRRRKFSRELMMLPPSDERSAAELDLRIVLGTLIATGGYTADETLENYELARPLSQFAKRKEAGDAFLSGLFMAYHNSGKLRNALEVSQELLTRAEQTGNPLSMSAGYRQVGASHSILGDFRTANEYCQKAVELIKTNERPYVCP